MTVILQERCAGADTLFLVARILHKSKAHLQVMLLQNNATIVEDFYVHVVCLSLTSLLAWSVFVMVTWDLTKLDVAFSFSYTIHDQRLYKIWQRPLEDLSRKILELSVSIS